MKDFRYTIRQMALLLVLVPVVTQAQSTRIDSVSFDGRFLKVEMVKVRTDTAVDGKITERTFIQLADSHVLMDNTVTRDSSVEDNTAAGDENGGEVNIERRKKKEGKESELVATRWNVLDLGFNNMLNSSGEFRMPAGYTNFKLEQSRSVNFHWGIFQQGIRLSKTGSVRLVYGLGMEYNNCHLAKNVDLIGNSDELTMELNETVDYKKNKVVTQYVTMPLMLHFKTNPKEEEKSLNVAVGVQAGYLFRAQQKQKWEEDGDMKKNKIRSDYNFSEYRYGYVIQFGYGHFNLFAKYYPTPVFRKDEGPDMNTVAMGLILLPF